MGSNLYSLSGFIQNELLQPFSVVNLLSLYFFIFLFYVIWIRSGRDMQKNELSRWKERPIEIPNRFSSNFHLFLSHLFFRFIIIIIIFLSLSLFLFFFFLVEFKCFLVLFIAPLYSCSSHYYSGWCIFSSSFIFSILVI